MLSVLSEINCLKVLNTYGVYPDYFYTDFEAFKNHVIGLMDADIVVIMAGTCTFNKRLTIEFIKTLLKRRDNENDKGIRSVTIISDTTLQSLDMYYKFVGNLNNVDLYSYWKVKEKDVDVLSSLSSTRKNTKIVLSKYDQGKLGDASNNKPKVSSEDDLLRLIKVPDVKSMLNK